MSDDRIIRQQALIYTFLYFASDKGHKSLPADKEAISASFIAGFIEWLTGKPAYEGNFKQKVKVSIFDWEEWANEELEKAVVLEKTETVGRLLIQDLQELLQYRWRYVPLDFSGWVNEVEDWLRDSGYDFISSDLLNLSVADVDMVEKEATPGLGPHIAQCLKEIAELSQKYLVQFVRR